MSTTQNPASVQPADSDRVDQHTARRSVIPRFMAGGPTLLLSQSPSPSGRLTRDHQMMLDAAPVDDRPTAGDGITS